MRKILLDKSVSTFTSFNSNKFKQILGIIVIGLVGTVFTFDTFSSTGNLEPDSLQNWKILLGCEDMSCQRWDIFGIL